MATINYCPKVKVLLPRAKIVVLRAGFRVRQDDVHVSGSYSIILGDIPNFRQFFKLGSPFEFVPLVHEDLNLMPACCEWLAMLNPTQRRQELWQILDLPAPNDTYTIEEIQILHEVELAEIKRTKRPRLTVDEAIDSGDPLEIRASLHNQKPTHDHVLKVYLKAKELRSNSLDQLARLLSTLL